MKSAILSVGTELLFGQIVNTNAAYLSKQLNLLGIDVMYHYTVGDNPKRLAEMMEKAFADCDLVITTGGLGPTQDDLTKEVAAEVMGDILQMHESSLHRLEKYFKDSCRTMTQNNTKQALLPTGAEVFQNNNGTAPGFALEKEGKTVICLPGPPREMTAMFEESVKPYLTARSGSTISYKMIRTFGIGESALETEIMDLIRNQTDPTIAPYAKEGEVALRIASKREDAAAAETAVREAIEKVGERIGQYIYSTEDEELAEVVGKRLLARQISLSCAESCTGGLFAAKITDIPGISAIFDRGLVTYSNKAKIEELGVCQETLDRFGAVSEETAREMAEGLARVSRSRLCVSVTGVAGPDGGTEKKPVGLIYIAACYNGKTTVREIRTSNRTRGWNRNYAVLSMLKLALDVTAD